MAGFEPAGVQALAFDVFGTVVDWRGSIIAEGARWNRDKGLAVDWAALADVWRAAYQPAMAAVREGRRPWVNLDALHRENLDRLLARFGLEGLSGDERDRLNRIWHRLDPWPDSVEGLNRLKRRYVLATLSNGNVALLVNMAKRAGLLWDAILGAEVARAYKPLPRAYLTTVELLGLRPDQVMLVAAHNGDLRAAAACGLKTAFVPRPREYGPAQTQDVAADGPWDVVAGDFLDLAGKLGA